MRKTKVSKEQEQIADRFPGTKAEEWRRHRNGGWIHKDAAFPNGEDKCFIGPLGVVRGGAVYGGEVSGGEVSGGVVMGGVVYGGAVYGGVVYGGVVSGGVVRGGVVRGGEVSGGVVYGGEVSGGAVYGGVVYGGVVSGGEVRQTPVIVTGKYTMSPSKPGYVTIGCETRTYNEWEQKGEDIAKSHGELVWYCEHVKPILPWFITQSKELFKGQKVAPEVKP